MVSPTCILGVEKLLENSYSQRLGRLPLISVYQTFRSQSRLPTRALEFQVITASHSSSNRKKKKEAGRAPCRPAYLTREQLVAMFR